MSNSEEMGDSSGWSRRKTLVVGSSSLGISTFVTIGVGLVLTGSLARYFTAAQFGLWTLLISLNGLMTNGFDLGFGNALRNRLAQLKASHLEKECEIYFISIFIFFLVLAILIGFLFFSLKPIIPWNAFLQSRAKGLVKTGATLFTVGIASFSLSIAFNLYVAGFFGFQQSHWNGIFNSISKLSVLGITVLLVICNESFFAINIGEFTSTVATSFLGFFCFLKIRKWYFHFLPLKTVIAKIRELWRQSIQFAGLQVSSTLLLYMDIFVVSRQLGLESAGDYFVVKRMYLVIASLHFAFLLPLWGAYTESMEKEGPSWSKRVLKKSAIATLVLFGGGTLFLVCFGEVVARLWTGKTIVPHSLFLWLGLWGIIYAWNNCFSVFLNATGNLKRQITLVCAGAACFVPLATMIGRQIGIQGICLSLIITSLPLAISNPLESIKILNAYSLKKGRKRAAWL